ncbi:uncharacterized protein LAESUDRAFT_111797 [Laetiporus sulphureus 93-53]|uniref:Uncharacterized protein n=1 Tax=Laetiporus sulphureus 93-53 TaxID=1314785 RepID=A0A165EPF9_9APHY|nr:uncharacterized protein LAESUDRAFT_111797 [Laetiporus sulphureus 93-53]KZT07491.1 hypothetical protein LAESUDRAFT_111797 [Laetiporus sulphureus 93-53]
MTHKRSSPATIPSHALARPRSYNLVKSVSRAMGFSGASAPLFRLLSKCCRTYSGRYLDETVTFRDQDPAKWVLFFDKVVSTCPFVKQYEGAWPVDFFMRNHLERTKYKYTLKIKASEASPIDLTLDEFFGEPDISGASSDAAGRPLTQASSQSRPRETKRIAIPQEEFDAISVSTRFSSATDSERESSPCEIATSSQLQCATRSSPSVKLEEAGEVAAFLSSLYPSMEALTAKFLEAGIVDLMCLRGLATLSDRDALLKDDIGLQAFQFRIVRAGLELLKEN